MTVCLFFRLFVSLSKFGVLQPSQRPCRQHCSQAKLCPRRKGKEKGRQDRWKNARTAGPCHTKTQNNKTPRHCKLPNTITWPNQQDWSCGCFQACTSARTRMDLSRNIYQVRVKTIRSRKTFFRLDNSVIVIRLHTDISTDFTFHMREREREREREGERQKKRNCQTKGNKSKKRYLTYIRGRQKHPISQKKMKNFVFSDNFHKIIYIIPAPFPPVPRRLYPRSLYPRPTPSTPPHPAPFTPPPLPPSRPLYPRTPPPCPPALRLK